MPGEGEARPPAAPRPSPGSSHGRRACPPSRRRSGTGAGSPRVQRIDVEVGGIGHEGGDAEGDARVVADGDPRQVQARPRRRPDRPRPPGARCSGSRARPARGAGRWRGSGGRWRCARRRSPSCSDFRGWRRGRWRRCGGLRRKMSLLRRQRVDGVEVGGDIGEVEAVGEPGLVRRFDLAADAVGVEAAGGGHAGRAGPPTSALLLMPWLRMRTRSSSVQSSGALSVSVNSTGIAALLRTHHRHPRVDPGDESRRPGLGVGSIGRPFGFQVAAIKKARAARRDPARHRPARTKQRGRPRPRFRQRSICQRRSRAALKPWAKKRSGRLARVDVRDAPGVDDDLDRRAQPTLRWRFCGRRSGHASALAPGSGARIRAPSVMTIVAARSPVSVSVALPPSKAKLRRRPPADAFRRRARPCSRRASRSR